jgi:hypothetical protein
LATFGPRRRRRQPTRADGALVEAGLDHPGEEAGPSAHSDQAADGPALPGTDAVTATRRITNGVPEVGDY